MMSQKQRAILAVIIMRISGYIYMLFSPFKGFLLSLFLDWLDWIILVWNNVDRKFYHKLDKPLDYLLYIFFIPILINSPVFPLYIGTMVYRGIGYIAYYTLKDQRVFVPFADFSQVVIALFFVKQYLITDLNILDIKLLVILFAIKMFSELFHHVFNPGQSYPLIQSVKSWIYDKIGKQNFDKTSS